MTDIEIQKSVKLKNIIDIAKKAGLKENDIECYGKYKAKIGTKAIKKFSENKDGKLILVTAMSNSYGRRKDNSFNCYSRCFK